MTLAEFLQLLHVASAFWFVAGLIGRDVVLSLARRSDDLGRLRPLLEASGSFEQLIVIPGSAAVMILGILTWWAEKLPLWGAGTRWVTVSLIAFLTLIPIVPLIFLPRGRVFAAAFTQAIEDGRVTPELSTAFRDPWVAAARWWERLVVVFVTVLMVTKPF